MSANNIAIIQARMSSSRLPGKVLMDILGKTVLDHVLDRLNKCKLISRIVIATTTDSVDDQVFDYCNKSDTACFRGSRDDVLSRFYECAVKYNADNIIRVTSDNPLVDPVIVDETIKYYLDQGADYAANNLKKNFPHGLDVEVISFTALEQSHHEAKNNYELEHVTQFVRHQPNKFKLLNYGCKGDWHNIRLTLDTEEDYQLISIVIELLGDDCDFDGIKNLFMKYPSLRKINEISGNKHNSYNKNENII